MEEILKVSGVSKTYPKFKLDDVSFTIKSGSITGFIGRNGAGKTTTLKGIMKLLHFDTGEVFVFGKNMKEHELEIKQDIGFALSELSYYPNKKIKTIANVTKRFYKNFDNERFKELCELFNLDKEKRIQELSSGMKVKYSLAIALSYDAKLLILDEPTSGLDPISRDEIIDIFQSIVKKENRAILFSTHITSDLDKCASDIVYIHDGKIVYAGSKNNLLNNYVILRGNKKDFSDALIDKFISYKNINDDIEALVKAEDKNLVKGKKITSRVPDLEEVMVYIERSSRNVAFNL